MGGKHEAQTANVESLQPTASSTEHHPAQRNPTEFMPIPSTSSELVNERQNLKRKAQAMCDYPSSSLEGKASTSSGATTSSGAIPRRVFLCLEDIFFSGMG